MDGQVAGRHDRGPRERCVHGDGPAVIVHEELVITDEREARVVDGEATREGRVADEVESDAVGALDRRAVARRALNDACDGVEGGTPIGHQGSDDTGRVAPASAVRTGGIPAAASLESQDRVRSEGRSRKDHADSRGAAPVAPCRPPVPSLSPRQRADPVVRDRCRVEKPVIVSERDHSRRVPSLASDGSAGSAEPSGQTVDRVRVDRGRTKDGNHGNARRVSATGSVARAEGPARVSAESSAEGLDQVPAGVRLGGRDEDDAIGVRPSASGAVSNRARAPDASLAACETCHDVRRNSRRGGGREDLDARRFACVTAPASVVRRRASAARSAPSPREGLDIVAVDRDVRSGCDDDARGRAASASSTSRAHGRVRGTVAAVSGDDRIDGIE